MVQTKHLSNYVIFGALSSTLFVLPILMDPVALPKLFILSFFYGMILLILFRVRKKLFSSKINFIIYALVSYSLFLLLSGLIDNQGLYQIFMGTWGRNNGLFQVLFFAVLFLGSVVSIGVNFPKKIIQTLFLLGVFFSSYAWLQHFGRDPITAILPWYKKDQPIVLTLGNSNFSSIFLAITFTATCVTLLKPDSRNLTRIISNLSLFSHFLLQNMFC
jgi:hypothetical protein